MKTPVMNKELVDATKLFKRIIAVNGMQKHNIIGWTNDIILPFLTDQEAWLGVWMLKSDELATVLTDKRLWNVGYQANKDCLEGVKPVAMDDIDSSEANIDTYSEIECASEEEIPLSLRFKICEAALLDSLVFEGKSVGIKPVFSFVYELEKPLEHGQFLPYSTADKLISRQLNDFNLEINQARENNFAANPERTI